MVLDYFNFYVTHSTLKNVMMFSSLFVLINIPKMLILFYRNSYTLFFFFIEKKTFLFFLLFMTFFFFNECILHIILLEYNL